MQQNNKARLHVHGKHFEQLMLPPRTQSNMAITRAEPGEDQAVEQWPWTSAGPHHQSSSGTAHPVWQDLQVSDQLSVIFVN